MKIGLKVAGAVIGAVAIAFVAGCASTGEVEKHETNARETKEILKQNESGVIVAANKTYVRDWSGRSVGAEAVPVWLKTAILGDYNAYMEEFGIDRTSGIIRLSIVEIQPKDLRGAQTRANLQYGRNIARELRQSIETWAAESMSSGGISEDTRDAIGERTKTYSQADISGHYMRTEFWQLLDVEDARTGKTSQHYVYYQIYEVNPDAWAATTAKYIKEVIGDVRTMSLEEEQVQDMLNTMMNDARHPTVMTQQQLEATVEGKKKMLEVELEGQRKKQDLMGEEMKNNRDLAMAEIIQNNKTERTQIKADAKTDMVNAALASGSPVYAAVASTSADDADWIGAMDLAKSILFN